MQINFTMLNITGRLSRRFAAELLRKKLTKKLIKAEEKPNFLGCKGSQCFHFPPHFDATDRQTRLPWRETSQRSADTLS